jgi:hypothetical protein
MNTVIAKTRIWPVKAIVSILDWFGPALHGEETDAPAVANRTWVVLLCVNAAMALMLIAIGHGAGRRGDASAPFWFWSGVILLLLPMVSRIAHPLLARGERLLLLVALVEFLFVAKMFYSPSNFADFDDMLHWASALDLIYHHKLFLLNDLLPISAYYPALELVTTALTNLTGLGLFPSAVLFLAILRVTFIVALFLFFEKLTGSARLAALACLIYMSCSTFMVFNASFSYESIGIVLCILVMLAEVSMNHAPQTRSLTLPAILLACLAVTHHMTALWCAMYMVGLTTIELLRRDDEPLRTRIGMIGIITLLAVAFPVLWMCVKGNPIVGYLGPVLQHALDSMYKRLNGTLHAPPRQMFVGADGKPQPYAYRIIGIGSTLLLSVGLATGYFRSLALATDGATTGWSRLARVIRRQWSDSRILLLTMGAFAFPASVAFRLTANGWEVGDRMQTSAFFSVSLVVAVAIVHFWQPQLGGRWGRLLLLNVVVTIIILGGYIVGSGLRLIRGPYLVVADAASVEPMSVDAALWTRTWLGEGNMFASDRVNSTLLTTYGQQEVSTTLSGGVAVSPIFYTNNIDNTLYTIRRGHIDYVWDDLRLTTALAVMGLYYEMGDEQAYSHGNPSPPKASSMLKFDRDERVSRVFDNGSIVIYDVRHLRTDQGGTQ